MNQMMPMLAQAGIPFKYWDLPQLEQKFGEHSPFRMDLSSFAPPKRIDDPSFGVPNSDEDRCFGALFVEQSGYVSDPNLAVLNLQLAAEATGKAEFLCGSAVTRILRDKCDEKVEGLELADGTTVSAPVVVNAGGPHSSQITRMAFSGMRSV